MRCDGHATQIAGQWFLPLNRWLATNYCTILIALLMAWPTKSDVDSAIGRLSDVQLSDQDRRLKVTFENSLHDIPFQLQLRTRDQARFELIKVSDQQTKATIGLTTSGDVPDQFGFVQLTRNDAISLATSGSIVNYELRVQSDRTKGLDDLCWNMSNDDVDPKSDNATNYWYGAPALLEQHWPLQPNQSFERREYITSGFHPQSVGTVVEYLWFSSAGYLIAVDPKSRLFIEQKDGHFCLSLAFDHNQLNRMAKQKESDPSINSIGHDSSSISLSDLGTEGADATVINNVSPLEVITTDRSINRTMNVQIFIGPNVRKTYEAYRERFIAKPRRRPSPAIYRTSIWSTWVAFKRDINQAKLLQHARQIADHGHTVSGAIFEIDDKWEDEFGTFEFDRERFPDPVAMIKELKTLNFSTSVWIHPFVNEAVFRTMQDHEKQHFVVDASTGDPLMMRWWNGLRAALVDFTSPVASDWFAERVARMLHKYELDTFKMDAGEFEWAAKSGRPVQTTQYSAVPNMFSQKVAETVAKIDNGLAELRTSFRSQAYGNLVRVMDKHSRWGHDNGLQSLIPTCLQYSMFGYSFLLPDMIGANAYNDDQVTKELFIRWAAANVFLPIMQFSLPPWHFDDQTATIALKFERQHQKWSDLFARLAQKHQESGEPIIRPMWWIAPDDPITWRLDSQYLLGNEVLVAPIVEMGVDRRNIYLPTGQWKDGLNENIHRGPKWLTNYSVALDQVAYFLNQNITLL